MHGAYSQLGSRRKSRIGGRLTNNRSRTKIFKFFRSLTIKETRQNNGCNYEGGSSDFIQW
jgi:hypothetical protein